MPVELTTLVKSLSARRAWIEITVVGVLATLVTVALRKESVDRNRNSQYSYFLFYGVALRKESVDRNCVGFSSGAKADRSLSARRAWIEITAHTAKKTSIAGRSPQGERG